MKQKFAQKGFTLIEMLVALAIVSLMVAIGMGAFDGSKSKAQALIGAIKQMTDANLMAKEDIGCFATNPVALFDQPTAANSFPCKPAPGPQLTRLYLARQQTNSSNEIMFPKISDNVSLTFSKVSGGLGTRYYAWAKNVPMDVIMHALSECNGNNAVSAAMVGTTNFSTYKCVASAISGDTADLFVQYAETR